ncbi:hypothetical protein V8D89_002505 [Ganoderma adspersum]
MEIKRMKTRSNSMRRFLRDVLKPTPALSTLGKRERTEDPGDHKGPRMGRTNPPLKTYRTTTSTACIALQNEDPLEDAIVITALSVAPFCCHADLITMSRTQLLTVAAILNAKLPRALQIDVGPTCSDVAIRYAIELLVGLRENPLHHPHPAPSTSRFTMVYGSGTPLRAHSLSPTSTSTRHAVGPSPGPSPRRPASPLVRPSRHSVSLGSPALPILHEDAREREEGCPTVSEAKPGPPQKKRRTDAPITRALSHRIAPFLASAHSDSSQRDTDSPTPSPRVRAGIPLTRTHTIAHDHDRAPCVQAETSPKKARSGGRHVRAKSLKAYMHMTSTPKRYGRAEAAVNSPEVARRFMSLLADMQDQAAGGSREGGEPEPTAPGPRRRATKPRLEDTAFVEKTADYSHGDTTVASVQTERREDDTTVVSVSVKVEELEPELTFGLDEMTMPVAGTEGDVERSETDISYAA